MSKPETRNETVLGGVPCPECGKTFGPTDTYKDMVVPQQLVPCGHSICATCIQSWETKCEDANAPVACSVCRSPVRDIVPNYLYCDMIMSLMRADMLPEQRRIVMLALLKQRASQLAQVVESDLRMMDVEVSLRAAATMEHDRAEKLHEEVLKLRRIVDADAYDTTDDPANAGDVLTENHPDYVDLVANSTDNVDSDDNDDMPDLINIETGTIVTE